MNPPDGPAAPPLESVRSLEIAATQRLLGDTIAIDDSHWQAPSRLPGWSRAHVATHLARQADALVRLAEWAKTGERHDMYASADQREGEIDAGSRRSGLDLQIDLDTAAGRLNAAFDSLEADRAWDGVVELRGGQRAPARLLPLARLAEVVLHHVDLDIGFELDALDSRTAEWILEWCAYRIRARDDCPKVTLHSDSSFVITLGSAAGGADIYGSSPRLLGWLTGRLDASAVTGAVGITPPQF